MRKDCDSFIISLCKEGGKTYPKYIDSYSESLESELKGLGYIKTDGEGIWKEIEITEEGRRFYQNGCFIGEEKRKSNAEYDRALDNRSKSINNVVTIATLIVSILSLVATIYFGLKN